MTSMLIPVAELRLPYVCEAVEVEDYVTNERRQDIITLHSADTTRLLADLTSRCMLRPKGKERLSDQTEAGPPGLRQAAEAAPVAETAVSDDSRTVSDDDALMSDVAVSGDATVPEDPAEILGRRAPSRAQMEQAILQACQGEFRTALELAHDLNRSAETLRRHYLSRMVRAGLLELQYPDTPTRKGQAYRTRAQEPS